MAGNTGLLESIEKAAEKERATIKREAEQASAEILEKAEAEARKIVDDFKNEKDILLITETSRIKNKSRREIQEKLFKLKNGILDESISLVLKDIDEIRKDRKQYKKILKKLLEESLVGFDDSVKLLIQVNKKDEQLIDEILRNQQGKKCKIESSGNFLGGLVVKDSNEKKIVYNTFESRLDRVKRQQISLLTKELF